MGNKDITSTHADSMVDTVIYSDLRICKDFLYHNRVMQHKCCHTTPNLLISLSANFVLNVCYHFSVSIKTSLYNVVAIKMKINGIKYCDICICCSVPGENIRDM